MWKPLSALAVGLLMSLAVAVPVTASHEGSSYRATLQELNDSGGSGSGTLTVSQDGETMSVRINATGLNLDGPHAMHLHGIVEGDQVSASSCPTAGADTDGDGVITVAEGAPDYGGVQVSLTTTGDTSPDSALAVERFPSGTSISYSRSGIPIPEVLRPSLGNLHFVVHGIDENGNGTLDMDQTERSSLDESLPREATAPAACGTLAVQAAGAIQTGAGGTADGGPSGGAILLVGMLGLLPAFGVTRLVQRVRHGS